MSTRLFISLLSLLVLLDGAHRLLSVAAGPAPLIRDAVGYWLAGQDVAQGDWFQMQHPSAFRPPLYPIYLGVCQFWFGSWALLAAVVGQHLMGVATSLLVGWSCRRLTDSNRAFLAGYIVSMLCLGRVQYANFIVSETLFTLMLAFHLAAAVAWHRDANQRTAAWLGLSLGLCLLVRPVAQWLWLPELGFLLLRRSGPGEFAFRQRLLQSACYLAVLLLLTVPWLLRNEWLYGQAFLTQSQGRHLWVACFSVRAADLPLPDEETIQKLEGVDYREEWDVYGVLIASGFSEVESDVWMRGICLKAIHQHPSHFAGSVLHNVFRFWWANNEALPWSLRYQAEREESYFGQRTWCLEPLLTPFNSIFRFVYRYPSVWLAATATAVFLGVVCLLIDKTNQRAGLLLLLILLYFAGVTALVQEPRYRYRMVLDPVMIVAAVAGFWTAALAIWNRACTAQQVIPVR